MGEMNIPFLCGGTFYILLLQALKKDRRIRLNDLDGYKAKEKAINDVTCLKGLVRTFYDFNEHFSDSTFTAHKNQYKLCEKNSTDWLRFETQYLVDAYDKKVRGNYALALEEMDSFIDTFIDDGDLGIDGNDRFNELNHTHWTIKRIDLVTTLKEIGVSVFTLS